MIFVLLALQPTDACAINVATVAVVLIMLFIGVGAAGALATWPKGQEVAGVQGLLVVSSVVFLCMAVALLSAMLCRCNPKMSPLEWCPSPLTVATRNLKSARVAPQVEAPPQDPSQARSPSRGSSKNLKDDPAVKALADAAKTSRMGLLRLWMVVRLTFFTFGLCYLTLYVLLGIATNARPRNETLTDILATVLRARPQQNQCEIQLRLVRLPPRHGFQR